MSMIKCPACGQSVSEEAGSCPHCGHPINKKNNGLGFWGVVVAIIVAVIILANG